MNLNETMTKLNVTLLRSVAGESVAIGLGGGSVALDALGWITPIVGLIGALLGVAAGWYTLRLKRAEFLRARAKWKNTEPR
jgi:ABC-type branched-subunit amino acid transport system permease subunit